MKDIDVVLKKIISDASETEVFVENISDDTNLISELGFHSLSVIKLLVKIEKEFGIETDEEDLNRELFEKYRNLKEYVARSVDTLGKAE